MPQENIRMISLDILTEVLDKGQYSHLVLRQALERFGYLSHQDRAFISRLCRGCMEHLYEMDAVINEVSSVKTEKMKPVIRNILRMAAFQLLYMKVPAHAVCNESVSLARKKGFQGLTRFVNGVTRTMDRKKNAFDFSSDLSVFYSVPEWLLKKLQSWYSEETVKKILESWNDTDGQNLYAHFHLSAASEETILSSLEKDGVSAEPAPYADHACRLLGADRIDSLHAFQSGWLQIQDISSMLLCQCASPEKGSLCLDLCSAPGGKGVYLAEGLNGSGKVVCRDISEQRTAYIEENRTRCRLKNMEIQVRDALDRKEEEAGTYDCVLADVPCSGLGVVSRKPDIRYHLSEGQLEELTLLQEKILSAAAFYVKAGGCLMYSTCTINPDENRKQVEKLIAGGKFETESLLPYLKEAIPGTDPASGMIQLLPGVHACDGFFLARLRRRQ